jgi:plasmid stabilization system protein ParE
MKRYVLTGPAERDLEDIKCYLVERAGARIARRVVSEIRNAILLLSSEPGIGHVRDLTERPVKFWRLFLSDRL